MVNLLIVNWHIPYRWTHHWIHIYRVGRLEIIYNHQIISISTKQYLQIHTQIVCHLLNIQESVRPVPMPNEMSRDRPANATRQRRQWIAIRNRRSPVAIWSRETSIQNDEHSSNHSLLVQDSPNIKHREECSIRDRRANVYVYDCRPNRWRATRWMQRMHTMQLC